MISVAGIYNSYVNASRAVENLRSAGISEERINLLAPGKGERFLFRGSVTKPGRTIVVADGQAYAFAADGEAKLIASMTGTMMTVVGRDGIEG